MDDAGRAMDGRAKLAVEAEYMPVLGIPHSVSLEVVRAALWVVDVASRVPIGRPTIRGVGEGMINNEV